MTTELLENPTALESKESEKMVIGCMFSSQKNLKIASERLDENDFSSKNHKKIFRALKSLYLERKPADVHLVSQKLSDQDELKDCGGTAGIATLAQYAGTSAYIEEYVEIVKNKSFLRDLLHFGQETAKAALSDPDSANHVIEGLEIKLKGLESRQGKKIPITSASDRFKTVEEFLNKNKGKTHLGLRTQKIKDFNENLLGLRGLILLAAAPNVGKTAFTVQTAIDVLSTEEDACLVYLSLEMTEEQILIRIFMYLSGIDYLPLVLGSQSQQVIGEEGCFDFYTQDERERFASAKKTFLELGDRLQIIDLPTCPNIDARTVINYVEALKQKTGCTRAMVVVDYLNVWPIPSNHRLSENEADKWRIGEMKKIRDALNNDPVMIISEARKPNQNDDVWGGDLSDVMGSARGTYTPDVVMLCFQLQPKAVKKLWESKRMPQIPIPEEHEDISDKEEKAGAAIISFLSGIGISLCKLKVPKCRDGMKRFNTLVSFHFHKNQFTPLNWGNIKILVESKLTELKSLKKES